MCQEVENWGEDACKRCRFFKVQRHDEDPRCCISHMKQEDSGRFHVSPYCKRDKRIKELKVHILLFHGPNELDLRDQFLNHLDVPVYFEKDLRKIASVFSCLSFFIGNDTGTTHIVAAVGVPLIVIFGPTPADEWKPWGKEFVALQGQENSCENVSIDEVYHKIKTILKMN